MNDKTELAEFLVEVKSNFKWAEIIMGTQYSFLFVLYDLRFEVRNNWNNLDEITVEDELEALT